MKLNWDKGFKRVTAVLSALIGLFGLFMVFSTKENAGTMFAIFTALAALPWALFYTVRWIGAGFAEEPANSNATTTEEPLTIERTKRRLPSLPPLLPKLTGGQTFALWFVLFCMGQIATDPKVLFRPAGGGNFITAILLFFIPVTSLQVLLFILALYYGVGYYRRREKPPAPSREPGPVDIRTPKSLFTRANLSIGWSLCWRFYLLNRIYFVLDQRVLTGTAFEIPASIIASILTFAALVHFAKSQAKRRFDIDLKGYGWPFLWRAGAGACVAVAIFFAVSAVMPPKGMRDQLILLNWFTTIPLLIALQCANLGWALHRYIAVQSGSEETPGPLVSKRVLKIGGASLGVLLLLGIELLIEVKLDKPFVIKALYHAFSPRLTADLVAPTNDYSISLRGTKLTWRKQAWWMSSAMGSSAIWFLVGEPGATCTVFEETGDLDKLEDIQLAGTLLANHQEKKDKTTGYLDIPNAVKGKFFIFESQPDGDSESM